MVDEESTSQAPFLKRWSQRKLAAKRESGTPSGTASPTASPPSPVTPPPAAATPAAVVDTPAPPTLPPVDSLSFESDFTAFLRPNVDEALRRKALRKLFADPHFNVMDGLDVYIDDYGKFEPMSTEVVAQLNQAKFLFDPPKTRVNEQGHVEDVPDEPETGLAADGAHDACAGDAAPAPVETPIVETPIVDNTSTAVAARTEAPAAASTPPPALDRTR